MDEGLVEVEDESVLLGVRVQLLILLGFWIRGRLLLGSLVLHHAQVFVILLEDLGQLADQFFQLRDLDGVLQLGNFVL